MKILISRSRSLVPPLTLPPLPRCPRRRRRNPPSSAPHVRLGSELPARVPLPIGPGCEAPLAARTAGTEPSTGSNNRPRRGCATSVPGWWGRRAASRRPSLGEGGAAKPGLARDLRTRLLVRPGDGIAVVVVVVVLRSLSCPQQGVGGGGSKTRVTHGHTCLLHA